MFSSNAIQRRGRRIRVVRKGCGHRIHMALSRRLHYSRPSAHADKCEGPSNCLTFLGIEIDTVEMELRLPAVSCRRCSKSPGQGKIVYKAGVAIADRSTAACSHRGVPWPHFSQKAVRPSITLESSTSSCQA